MSSSPASPASVSTEEQEVCPSVFMSSVIPVPPLGRGRNSPSELYLETIDGE